MISSTNHIIELKLTATNKTWFMAAFPDLWRKARITAVCSTNGFHSTSGLHCSQWRQALECSIWGSKTGDYEAYIYKTLYSAEF
jgi:hypothetical protein